MSKHLLGLIQTLKEQKKKGDTMSPVMRFAKYPNPDDSQEGAGFYSYDELIHLFLAFAFFGGKCQKQDEVEWILVNLRHVIPSEKFFSATIISLQSPLIPFDPTNDELIDWEKFQIPSAHALPLLDVREFEWWPPYLDFWRQHILNEIPSDQNGTTQAKVTQYLKKLFVNY
jgi:hypothetical protein